MSTKSDLVDNLLNPSYNLYMEQNEAPPEEEIPTSTPAPASPNAAAELDPAAAGEMDPTMGGDPNAMGMDPSMMGMDPLQQGPQSPVEVGRLYELKKIHSRLISLQNFLIASTEKELIPLRMYVNQAIELFRTLISNIQLFKDKLDDIVVMFYKFLDFLYSTLRDYYKDVDKGKNPKIPE